MMMGEGDEPIDRSIPFTHQCIVEPLSVPSRIVLEFGVARLREHESIRSGSEVNWLIDGSEGERLPTIDFAHGDLT
jgi:hypothetical protein